jgi:hypothetical protein
MGVQEVRDVAVPLPAIVVPGEAEEAAGMAWLPGYTRFGVTGSGEADPAFPMRPTKPTQAPPADPEEDPPAGV